MTKASQIEVIAVQLASYYNDWSEVPEHEREEWRDVARDQIEGAEAHEDA